jgi:hypothetical protein
MSSSLALIRKELKWSRYPIVRRFSSFGPEENLLICGGPRSGSTWLAELINLIPKTVILCEPLVLGQAGPFNALHFCWDQHIPENAEWEAAKQAFELVFRGKVLNDWTCMHSPLHRFLTADRMVVKFCHANALLPWLIRNFSFKYAPIFLIRHPFAVVASQLRHGNWSYEFSGYKIPHCPFNEFYSKHAEFLSKIRTKEEALVATWCLVNLVPLLHIGNNVNWVMIYYEHLLKNPRKEMQRIFDRWQLPVPDNFLDKVAKPSATTREATFEHGAEKQLAKWKSRFNDAQLKKMMTVLEYFGIEQYGMGILPKLGD